MLCVSVGWTGACFRLVPIGEASVVIAVSSPHRCDALDAVHWAIDTLKATVPIWKKVSYEGCCICALGM